MSLLDTVTALAALDAQQTAGAELDAGRLLPMGRQQIQPPDTSPLGATDGASIPQGDPLSPAIVRTPNDPPGWERIYEGAFLEAVLVTQLNGDFPGPVLAAVAVPFYSARPAADCDPARRARHWIPPRPSPARIKNGSPSGFTGSSSPMGDGCPWSLPA